MPWTLGPQLQVQCSGHTAGTDPTDLGEFSFMPLLPFPPDSAKKSQGKLVRICWEGQEGQLGLLGWGFLTTAPIPAPATSPGSRKYLPHLI